MSSRTLRFLPVLLALVIVGTVIALDHCADAAAREHCREHPFVDCGRLVR